MLQNGLANHNIRHRVRKREIVSIGDDRGPRSQRRIYGDDVEQRLCAQQLIESGAVERAANDHDGAAQVRKHLVNEIAKPTIICDASLM